MTPTPGFENVIVVIVPVVGSSKTYRLIWHEVMSSVCGDRFIGTNTSGSKPYLSGIISNKSIH